MDNKKKKNGAVSGVVIIIAAALMIGCIVLLTNRGMITFGQKSAQSASEVKKLKEKDLDLKYPSTPSEVVKLYWRFNKCIYNNSLKDSDLEALVKQLRLLYDEEFLGQSGNAWEDMLQNIKEDQKTFNKEKRVISTYTVDKEDSVSYAELDGKECATLTCMIMETVKSKGARTYAKFMCRKDGDGKWKIMGWEQIDESEATAGK